MAHPTAQEVSVPDEVGGLFALLDEVTRGLAREAALAPEERSARAESILAWFAPRDAAIKAAAAAAPCPVDRSPGRSGPRMPRSQIRIPAQIASRSGTSCGSDRGMQLTGLRTDRRTDPGRIASPRAAGGSQHGLLDLTTHSGVACPSQRSTTRSPRSTRRSGAP
jgi:hypothetical protein